MQIAMGVKAVDGLWNSTDPITWRDYEGHYENLPNGTLMQINVPNVNNTNEYYYAFKEGYWDRKIFVLNEADNTWKDVSSGTEPIDIATTRGMKIVTIPDSTGIKSYVAKDNTQYGLIPNISVRMRTETYVGDDINASNFMTYRTWNHYGSVGWDDTIYLAITGVGVNVGTTTEAHLFQVGVKLVTVEGNKVMRLSPSAITIGSQTNPDTEWGMLPTITNRCYSASESPDPVSSLDARVTRLENIMTDLQTRVAKLETDVKNIPQLIAWTNEGVNKFYVSR